MKCGGVLETEGNSSYFKWSGCKYVPMLTSDYIKGDISQAKTTTNLPEEGENMTAAGARDESAVDKL